MSEKTSNGSQPDSEPQYTVVLNNVEYALNEDLRQRIQTRARHEYSENEMFSCWWKVASESDAEESDIHSAGDPILVIETEGYFVPWERLDQLELEEQTTDAYDGVEGGDGGPQMLSPDEMDTSDEQEREKDRTHFGVTPQDFEEVPSPDGEDSDRIPAMPESFDEPKMVMFIPDDPEVEHSWSAGRALAPMHNWVEWNVQVRADQPRPDKDDGHDHWESMLKNDDCQQVGEIDESDDDILDKVDEGSNSEEDVPDHFEDGKYGGNNWNV